MGFIVACVGAVCKLVLAELLGLVILDVFEPLAEGFFNLMSTIGGALP